MATREDIKLAVDRLATLLLAEALRKAIVAAGAATAARLHRSTRTSATAVPPRARHEGQHRLADVMLQAVGFAGTAAG